MRVSKGNVIYIKNSEWAFGRATEDADERQGYFWTRRGGLMSTKGSLRPQRDDVCVPFAAIDHIGSIKIGQNTNVYTTLTRDEIEELPHRWQVQPQPTFTEMLRALPTLMVQPAQGIIDPSPIQHRAPTIHPVAALGDDTLARMQEAKRRHRERCQGAVPDEVAFLDQMLTDEIETIKAEYERAKQSYAQEVV